MKKAELLLPGGNLRKVKTALLYGADSVYVGTPDMSLRSKSEVTLEDLKEASRITKLNNKKLYLTLNLFSHNKDLEKLPSFVNTIKEVNPDGVLIADPGIFSYFREHLPHLNLHISTQANVCSSLSVNYWRDQGAKLCVLARELSFEEIKEIKEKCDDIKIEAFVHGSMCMTYSGRCLLSNFMAERGANQGSCAHSCRWKYKVKARLKGDKLYELNLSDENKDLFEFYLEEEFREGEYFEIQEDEMGAYILNSKDLCLMPVLDEYLKAQVDTFKIEGRNKSEYYVATTAKAYRYAIDSWYKDPDTWSPKSYMEELDSLQNRGYTLGFHHGRLSNLAHNYDITRTLSDFTFAGIVVDYNNDNIIIEIKTLLRAGDVLELISPFVMEPIRIRLYEFIDADSGNKYERLSPGRENQCIAIPLSLFHMQDKEMVKELLPVLSVVRKNNLFADKYGAFLKQNQVSFKVENSQATQSLLNKVNEKVEIAKAELQSIKNDKQFKDNDSACCSKGCNGCLVFWNDPKYEKLRDKLKNKNIGEKLIKNIDF